MNTTANINLFIRDVHLNPNFLLVIKMRTYSKKKCNSFTREFNLKVRIGI